MGATLSTHLQTLVRIAQAAGTVVMRHYETGCDARMKADRSPVTDADEEAETLILAELARGHLVNGNAGDAAETKNTGNQGDDQKSDDPAQHDKLRFKSVFQAPSSALMHLLK